MCIAQSVEQSPGLREVLGSNPGTADQCFSAIVSINPRLQMSIKDFSINMIPHNHLRCVLFLPLVQNIRSAKAYFPVFLQFNILTSLIFN